MQQTTPPNLILPKNSLSLLATHETSSSSSLSIYFAILSRQIADTYHTMAGRQKHTKFN